MWYFFHVDLILWYAMRQGNALVFFPIKVDFNSRCFNRIEMFRMINIFSKFARTKRLHRHF
jgi:hypothetical protein